MTPKAQYEFQLRRATGLVMQTDNELSEHRAVAIAKALLDDERHRIGILSAEMIETLKQQIRDGFKNPPE